MDKKKIRKENTEHISAQIGNELSKNIQTGTNKAIEGMDLFKAKGFKLTNVGYEQGKGNLFEYIEAAKLTRNMANSGVDPFDKFPVTDVSKSQGGFGENTAPDDFRFIKHGKVIGHGQAKVNNNPHNTAVNFINSKYKNMQKNTTSDSFDSVREQLDNMLSKGEISKTQYNEAVKNMKSQLMDPDSGITSGGTTSTELEQFRSKNGKISAEAVKKYAMRFEANQYVNEIVNTSTNMAAASAAISGIVSCVENGFAVLQNKKELNNAIKDIGVDVVKSGARGGITGTISSLLRIGGTKAKIPVLSDSSTATVIAAGLVDCGVAVYEYARGEITSDQLVEQLENTVIKSVTTIYFTKAAAAVFGGTGIFIPVAVYSVANYIVASTREIIKNAKLNAAEYDRIAKLNNEATNLAKEFHIKLIKQMEAYEQAQRRQMSGFLSTFDRAIMSGNNCDAAIYAIIDFANLAGIQLQHTDFNDFSAAMISSDSFVLGEK